MRKTGYLGEGGFMMRNNLYGMNIERTVRYDVHELRIKDWESMIGQSVEEALDLKPDKKAILGYYNGNPITAGGQKNYIENVFEMREGKLGIEVRETVGFGTGTKVDPVKGLVHGVTNDEFARIKEGLNLYHQVPPRCAHTTLTRAGEDPSIRWHLEYDFLTPPPPPQPLPRSPAKIAPTYI
jgi:hypothetical protein